MKKIAKQAARKIQDESLETLKTAKKQVAGKKRADVSSEELPEGVSPEEKKKIEAQGQRMREALEKEMEDIRKQKEQKEGEKLRQETLEKQKKEEEEETKPAPHVVGKPSIKIPTGMKGKLEKLKRKAEIRMPPSG